MAGTWLVAQTAFLVELGRYLVGELAHELARRVHRPVAVRDELDAEPRQLRPPAAQRRLRESEEFEYLVRRGDALAAADVARDRDRRRSHRLPEPAALRVLRLLVEPVELAISLTGLPDEWLPLAAAVALGHFFMLVHRKDNELRFPWATSRRESARSSSSLTSSCTRRE
jgi:hypothetical protein